MSEKRLSPKEKLVLEEIINGSTNKDISLKLKISLSTVKAHAGAIFYKLRVKSRIEAAVKGVYMFLDSQE